MKARDIMTKDVLSVDENISVKEAVDIMAKNQIGALIVQTPKPTFGIFTQNDLLTRVVAEGRDPEKTKIRDVMTESVQCVQADDSIEDIARIMYEENIRYLPVMEGRKLVGIISVSDLFKVIFRGAEGYQEEVI
ncbi:MAG: inosine-5-monophosphate dehydrogenase [Deltaproteobacteria bacterium]|jgi:CBS domain-containing protein|nr:Hypoxic response protein 1 [bacterium HR37]GIW47689.1 MAG: inosine-5-monophosphate dehydrogenase [Deltaproteobacteria bacterium]